MIKKECSFCGKSIDNCNGKLITSNNIDFICYACVKKAKKLINTTTGKVIDFNSGVKRL